MDITTKFIQEVHDLENTASLFNEAYTKDKSIFTKELQINLKRLNARITLFEKLWSRNMRGQLSDIKYFNNLNDYCLNIETTPGIEQDYPKLSGRALKMLTSLHEINEFAIIQVFERVYQCVVCRTLLLTINNLKIHANGVAHFDAIRKLIKPLKSYVEYWESNKLYCINKYITWTQSEAEIYCWGCDIILPIKAGIIHEHFLSQGHKSTTAYEDLLKTLDIWNKNSEKYSSKKNYSINLAVFSKYISLAEKSIDDPITITTPFESECSVKQDCQELSEESTFDDIIIQLDDMDYYCLLCSKFYNSNNINIHCSAKRHLAKLSKISSAHKAKDAHYCTFCKSIFFKFDEFSKHRNQPSHQTINLITQKCHKCEIMFLGTLDKICQHEHFQSTPYFRNIYTQLMNDQLTTGIYKRYIELNWLRIEKNQLYNKMFFKKMSTGVYVCTLCDCAINISYKNSVKKHIKSELHTESLVKFSHRYYCYPCGSTIKDLKTYDAHKLQSDHKERLLAQFCEKTCDKCGLIIFCDRDILPKHIHSIFKLITDVSDSAMDNSVQTKAHNCDEKIELISSFKKKEIIENQIKTGSNFDKNAQPIKINLLSTSGKFETDNEETLFNNSSPVDHSNVKSRPLGQKHKYIKKILCLLYEELFLNEYSANSLKIAESIAQCEERILATCKMLEKCIQNIFPCCRVYPFGSRISGLAVENSDLDVFVDTGDMYDGSFGQDNEYQEKLVTACTQVLEKSIEWKNIVAITHARTPIIKAYNIIYEIDCDISFKHGLGVENSAMIKKILDDQPIAKSVILVLKKWLKLIKVTINGYGLSLLVIFYLQQIKLIIPISHMITNEKIINGWNCQIGNYTPYPKTNPKLSEILPGFYKFYAKFNYEADVICPLLGESIKKSDFMDFENLPSQFEPYKKHCRKLISNNSTDNDGGSHLNLLDLICNDSDTLFCLQDPIDLSVNIMKGIRLDEFERFQRMCDISYSIIAAE